MSSPAMGSWSDLKYQACVSSCGISLKSKQKAVGYAHNICNDVAGISVSCRLVVTQLMLFTAE